MPWQALGHSRFPRSATGRAQPRSALCERIVGPREETAATKASADRYGIYPSILTTTAKAEESTPVDADTQDPAVNAAQADSEYVVTQQPTAVARGQEPPEETTSAQDSVAAGFAGDDNITPDAAANENFAEPKPFNVSPGEPARKPTSQRARRIP